MNHLSNEELYRRSDGDLPSDEMLRTESHLRSCRECRGRFEALRSVERTIRSLPLERAPRSLSHNVMAGLGLAEAPSWLYTLLKNVAPLVALTGVVIVVWFVLGKPHGAEGVQGAGESARGLFQMADEYTASGVRALNAWMATYFSFAKGTVGVTGFLIVFLSGIALLDRFVVMPLFRKRGVRVR